MNTIREFTVVMIDDDMPSMDEQIEDIKRYLEQDKKIETVNFHQIHVQNESDLDELDKYLENHVDLFLTDNSMINADDGLELAKKVRKKSILIDVLLYSTKTITIENYKDLSHYTQIQTHNEKKIVEVTKDLIDRNLSKWDDVLFLRGIVISESIEIEMKMNELLMKFFEIPDNKMMSFENLILGNFSMSLEAKKIELREVMKEAGLENLWTDVSGKIKELQENRNKLAHGKVDPNEMIKFTMGKSEKTFTKEEIISIFSNIKVIEKKLQDIEKALDAKMEKDQADLIKNWL